MKMNKSLIIITTVLFCLSGYSQNSIKELSKNTEKGEYGILEVRLNMEDEFRTLEGRDSQGLARISFYTGKGEKKNQLTKGFEGYDQVVKLLNEMKINGWELISTYPIRGESLIITHYVFEKIKK